MVLAHGYMDSRGVASWDQKVTASFLACVVVEHFLCTAAEDDHLFAGLRVSMDWYDRSWLDGIQHALGLVFRGIPEVVVLA